MVAELDPRTLERYRDVSFTTTLGRFVGGTSSQDTSLVVAADANGRAAATLRSGTLVGTAVVTAEIRDGTTVKIARSISIPFERVPASNVLSVGLSSAEAPADGATVTNVVARIASQLISGERTVTFSTTAGSFGAPSAQSTSVRADNSDTATAGLVSPRDPGTALVTASRERRLRPRDRDLHHRPARRGDLVGLGQLQALRDLLHQDLPALPALPVAGHGFQGGRSRVRGQDASTGQAFGFFSAVTPSDPSGVITAEFTPGNTPQRGEATIRARVPGTNVQSTVRVEVVDP